MRAFLSHSSVDKDIVIAVHDALAPELTWIDRAEIEWGDMFLEKISDGIEAASDFVLFWSKDAAKSEWVRLEINMAFIQALRRKAIRLRIVILDSTPLPLYLQPFHSFSVVRSVDKVAEIIRKLTLLLNEPVVSIRSRFVNRHDEIEKIEAAVDDPESRGVWAFGFTGVGKTSLIEAGLKRIFEGVEIVRINVNQGTGFTELALSLASAIRHEIFPDTLSTEQIQTNIQISLEALIQSGQSLLLADVQHWLDEDGLPQGPLVLILESMRRISALSGRPIFLTSTRRPSLDAYQLSNVTLFHVPGLTDEHIAALVRNWYFAIYGKDLSVEDSRKIAPKLYGHPVAARLVAGLLGNNSVDFLDKYPRELISLRRDLARVLLRDLKLSPASERLMETLALAGVALPAPVLAASGLTEDEFQQAVAQCAGAGLLTAENKIETHPLFQEFYWHRLHHGDYRDRSLQLADALAMRISTLDKASPEYVSLLQVTFRSYALAGKLDLAMQLRRDLTGELQSTAITLYNRRDYDLADEYISQVMEADPNNWKMRLYRSRVRIRQERWDEAKELLSSMLAERPGDIGVLHAMGWSELRQHHWSKALDIFAEVIAKREHVASLRDSAECLHRLKRNDEALAFLVRAKERESENPFVLDLESRILEDMGELEPAYIAAELAMIRDPQNGHLHNRLGMIRVKQGFPSLAVEHFQTAIELEPDQFSPANSLAAALLELDEWEEAEKIIPDLEKKTRTPSNFSLLAHTKARIAYAKGDPEASKKLLKPEIAASRNVLPNLGLLVRVHCAIFDKLRINLPALATVELREAEDALNRISTLDPDNSFLDGLRRTVSDRKR